MATGKVDGSDQSQPFMDLEWNIVEAFNCSLLQLVLPRSWIHCVVLHQVKCPILSFQDSSDTGLMMIDRSQLQLWAAVGPLPWFSKRQWCGFEENASQGSKPSLSPTCSSLYEGFLRRIHLRRSTDEESRSYKFGFRPLTGAPRP